MTAVLPFPERESQTAIMAQLRNSRRSLPIAVALLASIVATIAAPLGAQVTGSPPRGSLSGTVMDSVHGAPLRDAVVQVALASDPRVAQSVRTDSTGAFRVAELAPGRYLAGIVHPLLDTLGLEIPLRAVDVAPGAPTAVALAIPSAARILAAHCGQRASGDSSGAILGVVSDADTHGSLGGAKIVITWYDLVIAANQIQRVARRIPVTASGEGFFVACNLPSDAQLQVDAEAGTRASGLLSVEVPARGILLRSFSIGADTAMVVSVPADSVRAPTATPGPATAPASRVLRGQARVTGTVRAKEGAVANARVTVEGTGLETLTNADGSFALSSLPSGTHAVEVRALGYSPTQAPVELRRGQVANVSIHLLPPAPVLNTVRVASRRGARDITGFAQRAAHGNGRYLTREQIETRNAFRVTDLLRNLPGIRLTPTMFSSQLRMRGGGLSGDCAPTVFIDGMQIVNAADDLDTIAQPQDLAGVEVYSSAEAPFQYRRGACGVVLMWTRLGR
jgi:hypothetical protein